MNVKTSTTAELEAMIGEGGSVNLGWYLFWVIFFFPIVILLIMADVGNSAIRKECITELSHREIYGGGS